MTTKKLQNFFEEQGFNVSLIKHGKVQCAEIEKWTTGGVDMVIWLSPFTIEEFESYVNDFDVDNEIDLHRQDQSYKNNFTISESVKDFTEFHEVLKETLSNLKGGVANKNTKHNIGRILLNIWSEIGMNIPENNEEIVQYVFEDVKETSDFPNYSDGDVMIGLRRWIESKS